MEGEFYGSADCTIPRILTMNWTQATSPFLVTAHRPGSHHWRNAVANVCGVHGRSYTARVVQYSTSGNRLDNHSRHVFLPRANAEDQFLVRLLPNRAGVRTLHVIFDPVKGRLARRLRSIGRHVRFVLADRYHSW